MKRTFLFAFLLIALSTPLYADTQQQPAYDKEQVKQDYRLFLQQLKSLNAQYKEITGEMGKVMKEEGVPTWDMGETATPAVAGKAKENSQDLGGGAFLKETEKDMALTVDLPGYKKDSIKLHYKDAKTLVINADRKLDTLTRSFERSFDLPAPGDQKNSVAAYEDGVLTVKIPKTTSPQEVSIPIR